MRRIAPSRSNVYFERFAPILNGQDSLMTPEGPGESKPPYFERLTPPSSPAAASVPRHCQAKFRDRKSAVVLKSP